MFLNGRKFPSGNIKEAKWREYVHDILQFITLKDITLELLKIDSYTFF